MTPALVPLALPAADDDWTVYVDARVEDQLAGSRALIAEIKHGRVRDPVDVLQLWNRSETAISNVENLVSSLAEIHPSTAVRSQSEKRAQETTSYLAELGQDRALYDVFAGLDSQGLDADHVRLLERTLRDFRRSVDQDDAVRDRLRTIADRLIVLGQDFPRGVRDDVRSIRVAPGGWPACPRTSSTRTSRTPKDW